MMGNGLSNIIAAAILAFAIIWTGGLGGGKYDRQNYEAWLERAVGDIKNDIVISCGCCGEEGQRRAEAGSF